MVSIFTSQYLITSLFGDQASRYSKYGNCYERENREAFKRDRRHNTDRLSVKFLSCIDENKVSFHQLEQVV